MINWKTTIGGILVLLATTGQAVVALMSAGTHINWAQIGVQIVVGIALMLAKDFNVTGIGKEATTKVATLLLVAFASFGLTGCTGTLNAIQKVQVAEGYAKAEVDVLETAIQSQIDLMPADQKPALQTKFNEIRTKVAQAILVKDAAIQAAYDSAQSDINLSAIMNDLMVLIPAIINFAKSVGVDAKTVGDVEATHYGLQRAMVKP